MKRLVKLSMELRCSVFSNVVEAVQQIILLFVLNGSQIRLYHEEGVNRLDSCQPGILFLSPSVRSSISHKISNRESIIVTASKVLPVALPAPSSAAASMLNVTAVAFSC
jgi:hypothetical protein